MGEPASHPPDHLECHCPHCGGGVEFPAEMAGTAVDCPHCGDPLHLVTPESVPGEGGSSANAIRLTPVDLASAFIGTVPSRPPRFAYRLRLALVGAVVVILPVAYAAFVVGVIQATSRFAWGWFPWANALTGGTQWLPGKTLVYALGLLLGGLLITFLLRPLVARRASRSQALALNPAAEPLVVAFVHLVADAIGAAHPIRVEVDCRPNASAGFRRGWRGWFRGHRVVTIGLPLVAVLDARQLAGVLAHEFGHFNQGFALRASRLVRAVIGWLARVAYDRDGWDATFDRWESGSARGAARLVVPLARLGIGLSRALLKVLLHAGNAFSCALLREMELDADRVQIQLGGSADFVRTFRRLHVLHDVARDHYRRLRAGWDERRELPADFPASLAAAEASISPERRSLLAERQDRRERRPFDTHPLDAIRLRRAIDAHASGLLRLELPAAALFSNFGALSRQVTLLHYVEDLGLPREKISFSELR